MANRGQRVVFGLVATAAGLVLFLAASAYVASRGLPSWLAAVVGAFAFPVAPVTWQLLAERARKRRLAAAKTQPKAMLTGGDRFMLRLFVVALVVLGPMIALGRLDAVRGMWRHRGWFIPTSEPGPRGVSVTGLMARVPAEAELVFMFNQPADGKDPARAAVAAWGNRQLMLAVDGKLDLDEGESPATAIAEINKQRGKLPWLPTDEIKLVRHTSSSLLAASEGWRTRVDPPGFGPNPEILVELGRAPNDALIVTAFAPKTTRDVVSVRAGAAWLVKRGEQLVVEARVEALDEAAAQKLVTEAKLALALVSTKVPETCREPVSKLAAAVQLRATGAVIDGRVAIEGEDLAKLMFCGIKFD